MMFSCHDMNTCLCVYVYRIPHVRHSPHVVTAHHSAMFASKQLNYSRIDQNDNMSKLLSYGKSIIYTLCNPESC